MNQENPAIDVMGPEDLAAFVAIHAPAALLVRELGETPTVPAAAAALGVEADQIIKTLLFVVAEPANPRTVVIISNGERRVEKGAVATHFGVGKKRVTLAPAALVAEQVGYAVGGVPPFGHRTVLPVLLDASVVAAAERYAGVLYGGGGDDCTMMRVSLDDLLRICTPTVLPLSAAGA